VDRTDPEAVARAYVITRNTWDASRDKSNAYAYIRASVYEVPELASSHTKTPDLQHGQGEFLPLLANRAHTTVTITGSNNHGQQPNTDPTRWYGNVYYLRNYSDNSLEPVKGREVVFLRLQDDERGQPPERDRLQRGEPTPAPYGAGPPPRAPASVISGYTAAAPYTSPRPQPQHRKGAQNLSLIICQIITYRHNFS